MSHAFRLQNTLTVCCRAGVRETGSPCAQTPALLQLLRETPNGFLSDLLGWGYVRRDQSCACFRGTRRVTLMFLLSSSDLRSFIKKQNQPSRLL